MERKLDYKVGKAEAGLRIEQVLRRHGYSRGCLAHLKQRPDGAVVNGKPRYLNERLKEGDRIAIHICETESSKQILPVRLPLNIVYEDEDLLVVNKAAGMSTHPSMKNYDNRLANGLSCGDMWNRQTGRSRHRLEESLAPSSDGRPSTRIGFPSAIL